MGDTINDSLICLSKTQEAMIDTIDTVQQWQENHCLVEKLAFDIVNNTDRALKLTKDGHNLVNLLNSTCKLVLEKPNKINLEQLSNIIEEVTANFQATASVEKVSSYIAHELESRIAIQGKVGVDIIESLECVEKHLNQTVACTELDWI